MKLLPAILLVLCLQPAKGQDIPDSVTGSAARFAEYLQSSYDEPSDRLKTLYSWITANIQYDKDSAMYFNWSADHAAKISATLRRRKGVCENYASLLADIAGRLNIPAYVVHGYPSYADKNKDNSHSWVAVQQKGEWFLCDPTWDAQSGAEKYYMQLPADFIQTHIPFDPMWQLLEHPQHYKTGGTKFMYKDSVNAYLQLDSLQQLLATERRIKSAGNQNIMTKNWQSFNRMNIAVIAGEKDEELYNAAVSLLNKANGYFNEFVQYRNQQFMPAKTDAAINAMLQPVTSLLTDAEDKLKQMGKISENFQYDPGIIRQRIAALEKRTAEQHNFLRQYFTATPAERIKLFTK